MVLAAALMTLLLAAIRNAWDMTTFIVIRVPPAGQVNGGCRQRDGA
jgi:hypothetical protein